MNSRKKLTNERVLFLTFPSSTKNKKDPEIEIKREMNRKGKSSLIIIIPPHVG